MPICPKIISKSDVNKFERLLRNYAEPLEVYHGQAGESSKMPHYSSKKIWIWFLGSVLGFMSCLYASLVPRYVGHVHATQLLDTIFLDHSSTDPLIHPKCSTTFAGDPQCESDQVKMASTATTSKIRDVFLINVTNPKDVANGLPPILQQLPPVTLESYEGPSEIDVSYLDDIGVWRSRRDSFWKLREAHNTISLDSKIFLPNPKYAALLAAGIENKAPPRKDWYPLIVRTTVRQAIGWTVADSQPSPGSSTLDFEGPPSLGLGLATNVSAKVANWQEVFTGERHREKGLRYVRADTGLRYNCAFDSDCIAQEGFNASHPDSCKPDEICQPHEAGGFTTQSGFSWLPSGDFLRKEMVNIVDGQAKRWDVSFYWFWNASVVVHVPGNFVQLMLKRLTIEPDQDIGGAAAVRWGGVGVPRRLEHCPGVDMSLARLWSKYRVSNEVNKGVSKQWTYGAGKGNDLYAKGGSPMLFDTNFWEDHAHDKTDSPGIDCDGLPFTAHIGAAFDATLPPPLYSSIPQVSKMEHPLEGTTYLYDPDAKTNAGQSPLYAPLHVPFESFTPQAGEKHDFETYADCHATTGMVLQSQISWQLNLRIGYGPNRSQLFPFVTEALIPFVVVRDRSRASDEAIAKHAAYEKEEIRINTEGWMAATLGRALILGSLLYLRGFYEFWGYMWAKDAEDTSRTKRD